MCGEGIRVDRVLDTLLTGLTSLLATMESATDLEQVRPGAQTCGYLPDIGSPDSGCDCAGIPEPPFAKFIQAANGERGDHMTSTISDDRHTPTTQDIQMLATQGVEMSLAVDSRAEPRRIRHRSHTRFAHSTLSIPHALATSCRVSTCRQGSR